MKLQHLHDRYLEDMRAVLAAEGIPTSALEDGSKTGLKRMWDLLHRCRRDRAYSDSHPAFQSGTWLRTLPYDGSDYCEFYAGGTNDDHVTTLIRSLKKHLIT
jgi:hypothetical protein